MTLCVVNFLKLLQCFQRLHVKAKMFHTAMILIAGAIWTLASGMYTESIDKRMAKLEDALTHHEKALAHLSRIVQ